MFFEKVSRVKGRLDTFFTGGLEAFRIPDMPPKETGGHPPSSNL
jgi:hypothetical protein